MPHAHTHSTAHAMNEGQRTSLGDGEVGVADVAVVRIEREIGEVAVLLPAVDGVVHHAAGDVDGHVHEADGALGLGRCQRTCHTASSASRVRCVRLVPKRPRPTAAPAAIEATLMPGLPDTAPAAKPAAARVSASEAWLGFDAPLPNWSDCNNAKNVINKQ